VKSGFLHSIYEKLIKARGSPHEKSLGFGIGVCLGILPGMGPIAALFTSALFRANKATALAGSLITNTWLSIVTFGLAAGIGCLITGENSSTIREGWQKLTAEFTVSQLFKFLASSIAITVIIGYIVIGLLAGILSYAASFILFKSLTKKSQSDRLP